MDFALSEEQEQFRQSVRSFVERELIPRARQIDEADAFPRDLFQKCGDLGYFALRYPEEYGGLDADPLTFILMMEELARGSLAFASIVGMQALNGTDILFRLGTESQKRRLLEPALRGDLIATIAISEPDAGSDIGGITTVAEERDGGWLLRGRKMWITMGPVADIFIVAAKTDPSQRTRGIDLFLVERDRPGLSVGRKIQKLGTLGSETSEVILDDVMVPGENLLSDGAGGGFEYLRTTLAEIRAMTGALGLGLGQAALDAACKYAGERTQFGRPIGQFQSISHKLAEMATRLEAARWLVYRAGWEAGKEQPDVKLCAMAKLYASEMANYLADESTRIFGSYGFAMEYDVQRFFRDARFLLYGAGTSEILRTVIARQLQE